jgi:hypothetical protein
MRKIVYWADGVWCDIEDLETYLNYGWSDDFSKIDVPLEMEDKDIDSLVEKEAK